MSPEERSARRQSRRSRRLAAIVFLTATVLALGVAEVVARRFYGEGFNMLVDPYEEHIYRPFLSYRQPAGDHTIQLYTNSLGWKDDRPGRVVEKQPDHPRLVLLGDSFAEGLGVESPHTIRGMLQRTLDADGGRTEVLSAGRSSYSPLLEYQRFKRFLEAGYETDAAVLLYDISDVQDEIYYNSRYQFAPDGEPMRLRGWKFHPALRAVYNASALFRALTRLPNQLRALAGGGEVRPGAAVAAVPEELPLDYFSRDPRPISARQLGTLPAVAFSTLRANWMAHPQSLEGWAAEGLRSSFDNISRMKRLADARKIRFLLVIYPWPQLLYTRRDPAYYEVLTRAFPHWYHEREYMYGRNPAPAFSEYQRRVHRFAEEKGIPLLDLIPEFEAVPQWHRLFLHDDVHFNEVGSRFAAVRIAAALRRLGVPEEGR
jgi:lysophospholipase L1-like esterase